MDFMAEMERRHGGDKEERIGPREVELIRYRDNRTPLLFKLVTGETIEGAIRWYDTSALRVVQADRTELTISLQAIVYYKTRS